VNKMKKNALTEEDRGKLREYFDGCTTIQIHKSGYHFDDKAQHLRIGVLKREDFDYLKKDQVTLFIGTERGLIDLALTHRQVMELKQEIFRYEAVFLGRGPKWMGKKITTKDVEWKF